MSKRQLFVKGVSLFIGFGILLFITLFAEYKYTTKQCNKVEVSIQPQSDQSFVTAEKVMAKIAEGDICGRYIQDVVTNTLLRRLKCDDFIKCVSVYKTWQGGLIIAATRKEIIARTVSKNGIGQYIDAEGALIPLSPTCTAKVLLLEHDGEGEQVYDESKQESMEQVLLPLLKYINGDPFWQAQIAHIRYSNGKINLYTRIGNQVIEFGAPVAITEKFMKLKYFYHAVIPYKRWYAYSRVNVTFNNQLVCE